MYLCFNDSAMASWLRLFLWGLSLGKMTHLRSLLSGLWDWGGGAPLCGGPTFRWEFWLLAENGKTRPRSLTSLFSPSSPGLENNKFEDDIVQVSPLGIEYRQECSPLSASPEKGTFMSLKWF